MKYSTGSEKGFTLIELILVIVVLGALAAVALPRLIDLTDDADLASLQAQANNLISNDNINVAACAVGNGNCVDITSTGDAACQEAMNAFLPGLDTSRYSLRNIPSNTPRDQWQAQLNDGEVLFWVTRFLGDDSSNHPGEAWFNTWSATQPCALSLNL